MPSVRFELPELFGRARVKLWPLVLLACIGAHAELPPLIDRDSFFGEPAITGARLSPDSQYVSFLRTYNGTRNIWVKKANEPFASAKPVSAESKRPISAYMWSLDGRFILYSKDQLGDENYNVYAIDPTAPADPDTSVPPARNITNVKFGRAVIYALPRNDKDVVYLGLNSRDSAWSDLFRVRISTGEKTLVRKNTDRISGWLFDNAGTLRLGMRTDTQGNTQILRVEPNAMTEVYSCNVFEKCSPIHFDHSNRKVYVVTNKGPSTNLMQLALLSPDTKEVTLVDSDPKKKVDLQSALFSEVDDRLLSTVYYDERQRVYWKDQTFGADYKWLRHRLPDMDFDFVSHGEDEKLWLISGHSDVEPGTTYLFDRKAKKLVLQYRVRDELPRDSLAHMHQIHYRSSDGVIISAYFTLPTGVLPKGLSLMVCPHGGPWERDRWGFDSFTEFFANRGYAVLQPNFRGSTGFGKKFLNAGNGEWGRKMQDDLTWGIKFLVARGIVNPNRVGIFGISYGGYAALAGVAFTPDLYAAAVAVAAPSDLPFLLHSIPAYWEAGRSLLYTRLADPETTYGRKLLEAESPVHVTERIRTPLLVVQGAHDPRVNKHNSDEIVAAIRDKGRPVEYLVAPDEGHGFARSINNLAMVAEMEKFLATYLNGRYQSLVPTDVAARLKEITVKPESVVRGDSALK